jgi:hypothetical protein
MSICWTSHKADVVLSTGAAAAAACRSLSKKAFRVNDDDLGLASVHASATCDMIIAQRLAKTYDSSISILLLFIVDI